MFLFILVFPWFIAVYLVDFSSYTLIYRLFLFFVPCFFLCISISMYTPRNGLLILPYSFTVSFLSLYSFLLLVCLSLSHTPWLPLLAVVAASATESLMAYLLSLLQSFTLSLSLSLSFTCLYLGSRRSAIASGTDSISRPLY